MSQQTGLDYIIENKEFSQKLSAALDTNNVSVKKQVVELLSALCVYSPEGYGQALAALVHYKETKKSHHRFSVIVDELKQADCVQYKTTLLAFVNCIIISTELLEDRIRVRNEFIGLKLLDSVEQLRKEAEKEEAPDLVVQLDVFDEQILNDEDSLPALSGIDLSNHTAVFNAVLKQVLDTPCDISFLSILQHLLQVDPKDEIGAVKWETIEKLTYSAILIEKADEADKLVSSGQKRLAKALSSTSSEKGTPSSDCCAKCGLRKSRTKLTDGTASAATVDPAAAADAAAGTSPQAPAPPPPPPPPPPFGLPGPGGAPPPPPPPPPRFPSAPGAPPPPPGSAPIPAPRNKLPQQETPAPKHKTRKLQWQKIPLNSVYGKANVWTTVGMMANGYAVDFDAVEQLFSAEVKVDDSQDTTATLGRRAKKEASEVNVLDQRTSLKVNIFLKQFRLSHAEIVQLVLEGRSKEIGAEKLRGLLKVLPAQEEIDLLKNYTGDVSKLACAEKFYLHLLSLPYYKLRVEIMLLKEEFANTVGSISEALDTIIVTAQDLKESKMLQEILYLVLVNGNFLNAGVYAGDAAGIKLTSLLKLTEMRANKPRMNLLHVVVMQAEKKNPKLLNLPEEFKYLKNTADINIESLAMDIHTLRDRVTAYAQQLQTASPDVQAQFSQFLESADNELNVLEGDIKELDCIRLELVDYFVEDPITFKLEECFSIMRTFADRFKKAVAENRQREAVEKQQKMRRNSKKTGQPAATGSAGGAKSADGSTTEDTKILNSPTEDEGYIVDSILGDIRNGFIQKKNLGEAAFHVTKIKKVSLDSGGTGKSRGAASSDRTQLPSPDISSENDSVFLSAVKNKVPEAPALRSQRGNSIANDEELLEFLNSAHSAKTLSPNAAGGQQDEDDAGGRQHSLRRRREERRDALPPAAAAISAAPPTAAAGQTAAAAGGAAEQSADQSGPAEPRQPTAAAPSVPRTRSARPSDIIYTMQGGSSGTNHERPPEAAAAAMTSPRPKSPSSGHGQLLPTQALAQAAASSLTPMLTAAASIGAPPLLSPAGGPLPPATKAGMPPALTSPSSPPMSPTSSSAIGSLIRTTGLAGALLGASVTLGPSAQPKLPTSSSSSIQPQPARPTGAEPAAAAAPAAAAPSSPLPPSMAADVGTGGSSLERNGPMRLSFADRQSKLRSSYRDKFKSDVTSVLKRLEAGLSSDANAPDGGHDSLDTVLPPVVSKSSLVKPPSLLSIVDAAHPNGLAADEVVPPEGAAKSPSGSAFSSISPSADDVTARTSVDGGSGVQLRSSAAASSLRRSPSRRQSSTSSAHGGGADDELTLSEKAWLEHSSRPRLSIDVSSAVAASADTGGAATTAARPLARLKGLTPDGAPASTVATQRATPVVQVTSPEAEKSVAALHSLRAWREEEEAHSSAAAPLHNSSEVGSRISKKFKGLYAMTEDEAPAAAAASSSSSMFYHPGQQLPRTPSSTASSACSPRVGEESSLTDSGFDTKSDSVSSARTSFSGSNVDGPDLSSVTSASVTSAASLDHDGGSSETLRELEVNGGRHSPASAGPTTRVRLASGASRSPLAKRAASAAAETASSATSRKAGDRASPSGGDRQAAGGKAAAAAGASLSAARPMTAFERLAMPKVVPVVDSSLADQSSDSSEPSISSKRASAAGPKLAAHAKLSLGAGPSKHKQQQPQHEATSAPQPTPPAPSGNWQLHKARAFHDDTQLHSATDAEHLPASPLKRSLTLHRSSATSPRVADAIMKMTEKSDAGKAVTGAGSKSVLLRGKQATSTAAATAAAASAVSSVTVTAASPASTVAQSPAALSVPVASVADRHAILEANEEAADSGGDDDTASSVAAASVHPAATAPPAPATTIASTQPASKSSPAAASGGSKASEVHRGDTKSSFLKRMLGKDKKVSEKKEPAEKKKTKA